MGYMEPNLASGSGHSPSHSPVKPRPGKGGKKHESEMAAALRDSLSGLTNAVAVMAGAGAAAKPTSLSQLDNAAVRSKSFMAVYEQMCTVRSAIEKESDATIRAILNSKLPELQEALKEHAPSSSASDASK